MGHPRIGRPILSWLHREKPGSRRARFCSLGWKGGVSFAVASPERSRRTVFLNQPASPSEAKDGRFAIPTLCQKACSVARHPLQSVSADPLHSARRVKGFWEVLDGMEAYGRAGAAFVFCCVRIARREAAGGIVCGVWNKPTDGLPVVETVS